MPPKKTIGPGDPEVVLEVMRKEIQRLRIKEGAGTAPRRGGSTHHRDHRERSGGP